MWKNIRSQWIWQKSYEIVKGWGTFLLFSVWGLGHLSPNTFSLGMTFALPPCFFDPGYDSVGKNIIISFVKLGKLFW